VSDEDNQTKEMLGQLITMVGSIGADLKDTKEILHAFRSETDVHFRKLDRRVKLIESDLDETIVKVAEITIPKN
jgi:ferritin-like protein